MQKFYKSQRVKNTEIKTDTVRGTEEFIYCVHPNTTAVRVCQCFFYYFCSCCIKVSSYCCPCFRLMFELFIFLSVTLILSRCLNRVRNKDPVSSWSRICLSVRTVRRNHPKHKFRFLDIYAEKCIINQKATFSFLNIMSQKTSDTKATCHDVVMNCRSFKESKIKQIFSFAGFIFLSDWWEEKIQTTHSDVYFRSDECIFKHIISGNLLYKTRQQLL